MRMQNLLCDALPAHQSNSYCNLVLLSGTFYCFGYSLVVRAENTTICLSSVVSGITPCFSSLETKRFDAKLYRPTPSTLEEDSVLRYAIAIFTYLSMCRGGRGVLSCAQSQLHCFTLCWHFQHGGTILSILSQKSATPPVDIIPLTDWLTVWGAREYSFTNIYCRRLYTYVYWRRIKIVTRPGAAIAVLPMLQQSLDPGSM